MNQSHRHASTAALAGQKRKLPPRPSSMLMISPASDTNLMTVYQHQPAVGTSAGPAAAGAPVPIAPATTTTTTTTPGYTPIQPALPTTANQPWPTAAPGGVVSYAPAALAAPSPAPTNAPVQLVAAPVAGVASSTLPSAQHATVLSTPMVQLVAQKGAAAVSMPATLALAQAHAAAAAAAGGGAAPILQQPQKSQQIKTTTTTAARGGSKIVAAPAPKAPPPAPPVPSPAEYVKKKFLEWGVQTQPTRDATYFLKATPDRIAAYNRDLLATVRQRDMTKLEQLHREGKVKNACNPFGESLLHLACRKGLTEVVVFLCAKPDGPRLSLFVHDDYGRTVLHDACWTVRPQWPLIEFLMEHAPQLLACSDVRGHIPLDYIPKSDWKVWLDFLVQREAKLKTWMMSISSSSSESKAPSGGTGTSQTVSSSSSTTTAVETKDTTAQSAPTAVVEPTPKSSATVSSGIAVPQQVLDKQQQQQQDLLKATLQAAVMEKSTASSTSTSPVPPALADASQSSSSSSSLDAVTAATATVAVVDSKEVSPPVVATTSTTEGQQAPRIMG